MTQDERRRRIMQAAEELFGTSGYAAVSMADVAQRCEMSKKTLYEVFAGKEELFKALIADRDAFSLPSLPDEDADPGEALRSTLMALAHFVLSERQITMTRLVIAESGLVPEMAKHYYEQGIMRGKKMMVSHIRRLARQGRISVDDIEATADILFGASIGVFLLNAVSLRTRPNMKRVEARIAAVVDRFV